MVLQRTASMRRHAGSIGRSMRLRDTPLAAATMQTAGKTALGTTGLGMTGRETSAAAAVAMSGAVPSGGRLGPSTTALAATGSGPETQTAVTESTIHTQDGRGAMGNCLGEILTFILPVIVPENVIGGVDFPNVLSYL